MGLNLSQLNANQREAVTHTSGPLLILAGAGSGKTSTMSYRIAHLIAERNVSPSCILGLSFTKKAAIELRDRVRKLVAQTSGKSSVKGISITTFHSLCAKILRSYAPLLGFQSNFTILDQHDQGEILKQVLRNIKIDDRRFDLDLILFQIGQAKNRFLKAEEAETFFLEGTSLSSDYALATSSSYTRYQEQLKLLNAMDFDDLIYYTVELLKNYEEARTHYNQTFRHILIDEYQDTNEAQFQILKLLTESHQNICVVGDDDQSIYSWRGANPTHILEFPRYYPNVKTVTLDQNYRSTSRILEAANHVIEKNKKRFSKKLWSDRGIGESLSEVILEEDRAEAEYVSEEILKRTQNQNQNQNWSWRDFAILYRSNAQSRNFEEAFRRKKIPYKIVGGLSFLDRKEVKDVLSYLRLITNLKDDAALRRIINWPSRGMGKATLEALNTFAFQNQCSVFESLGKPIAIPQKSKASVLNFRSLILGLREGLTSIDSQPEGVAQWAKSFLEKIEAKKAVQEENDDALQVARKWENVEELIHSIGQFKVDDTDHPLAHSSGEKKTGLHFLQEFLNRILLESQENEKEGKDSDAIKNQVTLLTFHGAKGLEFPIVFMVGMEEGFLPHKRTLEEFTDLGEERRLCYVGITRARDHLILTRAKNRIRYGKPVPRLPSRFLEEIPSDLRVRIDESHVPDFSSKAAQEEHENKIKNYLAQIKAQLVK